MMEGLSSLGSQNVVLELLDVIVLEWLGEPFVAVYIWDFSRDQKFWFMRGHDLGSMWLRAYNTYELFSCLSNKSFYYWIYIKPKYILSTLWLFSCQVPSLCLLHIYELPLNPTDRVIRKEPCRSLKIISNHKLNVQIEFHTVGHFRPFLVLE